MATEGHPGSFPSLLTRHLTELRKQLRLDFLSKPELESRGQVTARRILLAASMVGWRVKESEPPLWWRQLASSLESLLTCEAAPALAGLADARSGLDGLARHLESMLPLRDAGVDWATLERDPGWEEVLSAFLGSGRITAGTADGGGFVPAVKDLGPTGGEPVLILVQSPFRRKQLRQRLESVGAGTVSPADLDQAWEILAGRGGVLAVVADNVSPSNHLAGFRAMVRGRELDDPPPMVLVVPGGEPPSVTSRRTGRLGAVGAWREPFRLRDLARVLS